MANRKSSNKRTRQMIKDLDRQARKTTPEEAEKSKAA